jgi:hypothetical protein
MKFGLLRKKTRNGSYGYYFIEKTFGLKLKQNKDLLIAPPKMDITNLVTSFVYPKLEVTKMVSFPPSNDGRGIGGSSPKRGCEQTIDGKENSETWCGKNQVGCYVVQVVYLEMLETTMERLGIQKNNNDTFSLAHWRYVHRK